jgi:hypothetical protein
LNALQETAERAPNSELLDLVARSERAAAKIDLDEVATRDLIGKARREGGGARMNRPWLIGGRFV